MAAVQERKGRELQPVIGPLPPYPLIWLLLLLVRPTPGREKVRILA